MKQTGGGRWVQTIEKTELDDKYRRASCPQCKLYHGTHDLFLESIRKTGLKTRENIELPDGWYDDIGHAIVMAEAYVRDAGCSHDGAVFFYNDKSILNRPLIEVDIRDIPCEVSWAEQNYWEDLVGAIAEGEEDEEILEGLASEYCSTFDVYPDGNELQFNEDTMKFDERFLPKEDGSRQVMVFCDLPPEILKIVGG